MPSLLTSNVPRATAAPACAPRLVPVRTHCVQKKLASGQATSRNTSNRLRRSLERCTRYKADWTTGCVRMAAAMTEKPYVPYVLKLRVGQPATTDGRIYSLQKRRFLAHGCAS